MKKGFLLLFLLASSLKVIGQVSWKMTPKIERNAYTTLEGSIDNKYPISMYLEYSWNWCGPNDNNRWNPRIIRGWYQYMKIGKRIPATLFACGWDCSFATEGRCLVTNSRTTFRHLSIETQDKYYSVFCGLDCAGSNKICFEGFPIGYTLISGGKDTICPAQIEFKEGQTIIIDNSGGDRACASRKFIFRNNQLIETK